MGATALATVPTLLATQLAPFAILPPIDFSPLAIFLNIPQAILVKNKN
jgi:hypothetical protein